MGTGNRSASDGHFTFCGTNQLFVHSGHLLKRTCYGVVNWIAVSILIGTSYIHKFIMFIFPRERMILPVNSSVVLQSQCVWHMHPSISRIEASISQKICRSCKRDQLPVFWVAKQVLILPNIEMMAPVTTSEAGLHEWLPHLNVLEIV